MSIRIQGKVLAKLKAIKESLNENTLIGHGYVKPFGYPGDFTIIHNIYKLYVNPDERYSNVHELLSDPSDKNQYSKSSDLDGLKKEQGRQQGGGDNQ